MNPQLPSAEPDPDAIKMFVGQIPRYMNENDLQKIFDEYGPVYQLNVLRDKATGHSKGCCFVTFYTRRAALEAQNALHNMKTLPGMQHPVQMKPADSEKRVEERKLFVGMLSKKCTENEVRLMFSQFGAIEECTVLREQTGQSKGCAFITFASRQCAQNAIRNLHHSRTLEGCRSPLVVKLADSQKEKEMKRLQQMQAQLLNGSNVGALSQQYLALLQQSAGAGNGVGPLGNLGNLGLGLSAMQMQQLLSAVSSGSGSLQVGQGDSSGGGGGMQNLHGLATLAALANNQVLGNSLGSQNMAALQHMANNSSAGGAVGGLHNLNSSLGSGHMNNVKGNMSMGTNSSHSGLSSMSSLQNALPSLGLGGGGAMGGLGSMMGNGGMNGGGSGGLNNSGMSGGGQMDSLGVSGQNYASLQQQYNSLSGLFNLGGSGPFGNTLSGGQQFSGNDLGGSSIGATVMQSAIAGKQTEGPDGANLFIYHLPQEYGDQDLMQMFLPFGSVISSKVYIDKQTNLSKCFGFVSYDSPLSAQNAIQSMNGHQVGVKRLKVQLKRPKSDVKLY